MAVHVIKLEDLPDPLSRPDFRVICQRQGIPIHLNKEGDQGTTTGNELLSGEKFDQFKAIK